MHGIIVDLYGWVSFRVNVGKYTSTMEHLGYVLNSTITGQVHALSHPTDARNELFQHL